MTREDAIVHILAEVAGGRSVAAVLREDDDLPASTTFWRWHMEDEALRDNLARARENGVEALLEEARDIADNQEMGEIVTEEPLIIEGKEFGQVRKVRTEDMLGHRKLRIETRIKMAQMIAPRKYGPKMELNGNLDGRLKVQIVRYGDDQAS